MVSRSRATIEFTVADRTGDDAAETIRYACSATSGDPLTRQYNAGTIVEIVEGVHGFDLGYEFTTITETTITPGAQYPNQLIVNVDSVAEKTELEFVFATDTWCGEYFVPTESLVISGY